METRMDMENAGSSAKWSDVPVKAWGSGANPIAVRVAEGLTSSAASVAESRGSAGRRNDSRRGHEGPAGGGGSPGWTRSVHEVAGDVRRIP